jgi:CarD family transcriptional regulator
MSRTAAGQASGRRAAGKSVSKTPRKAQAKALATAARPKAAPRGLAAAPKRKPNPVKASGKAKPKVKASGKAKLKAKAPVRRKVPAKAPSRARSKPAAKARPNPKKTARGKSATRQARAKSMPARKPAGRKSPPPRPPALAPSPVAHEHSFTPRRTPARQYRRGDKVVLPPYGVGVVEGTVSRLVGGAPRQYYEVGFPGGTSRAYVPVDSPGVTGFRAALTPAEVSGVLDRLKTGRMSLPKQWAARNRRVTEILASGDAHRIAVLAAELRRRDAERGLPDLDRQSYRRAIRFLAGEVASATGATMPEVREMMEGVADQDDLFA